MDASPHITVVVPVRDRREQMLRCLRALERLDYPSYDVLVLDNESVDGTAAVCIRHAANARIQIRVERVAGTVGRVRNEGGRLAGGELVAFTDSDCEPDPGWLKAAVSGFRDEQVGVVCGQTLPAPDQPIGPWAAYVEARSFTGRFESCNVIFRRTALVQSAGFDELVGHLWEDTAAGHALLSAGWRAHWAPNALVYHDVTHPGLFWHLRRAQEHANLARIVRLYPRLRDDLLWHRVFLGPQSARTAAAVAGVLVGARWRPGLLLALPYLWVCRQWPSTRGAADFARGVLFDLATLIGTLRGSARWRRLVL